MSSCDETMPNETGAMQRQGQWMQGSCCEENRSCSVESHLWNATWRQFLPPWPDTSKVQSWRWRLQPATPGIGRVAADQNQMLISDCMTATQTTEVTDRFAALNAEQDWTASSVECQAALNYEQLEKQAALNGKQHWMLSRLEKQTALNGKQHWMECRLENQTAWNGKQHCMLNRLEKQTAVDGK